MLSVEGLMSNVSRWKMSLYCIWTDTITANTKLILQPFTTYCNSASGSKCQYLERFKITFYLDTPRIFTTLFLIIVIDNNYGLDMIKYMSKCNVFLWYQSWSGKVTTYGIICFICEWSIHFSHCWHLLSSTSKNLRSLFMNAIIHFSCSINYFKIRYTNLENGLTGTIINC